MPLPYLIEFESVDLILLIENGVDTLPVVPEKLSFCFVVFQRDEQFEIVLTTIKNNLSSLSLNINSVNINLVPESSV